MFTAADYAYSFTVRDHLKESANMLFTDESTLSLGSSYKSSIYPNNGRYPPSNASFLPQSAYSSSVAISRGPSYPGQDSPTPRASTSSSSVHPNGIPIEPPSSPTRGSHFYPSSIIGSSPSSHYV
ncbi:hypothetical protein BCR43DRAFT_125659 [Syncephalastrum racemosum]|uniref:Uncharacterized protein n=1 Tax=Syncephalastrum racemosum TaxID=13706 RepID=A0A1X2HKN1_SYNRA|nr:hypothetical protein BCR43DRAFT_125659 [Syncephalastrum racemosum]